ncbi:autotransporter assembly complex protein TamA [Alteromonas gilva]|uniref:Translocation and assembly module subunit TamA n=1 Tax=Alteromonas gilva TaxID=2987522 RepID=A0ABT5KWV1_9ALTE|nr:autotransporter assembly complex family protein [Alteromonas gilva]MDC8829231.1 autotransporter assembly complex protein TamA [Alteromonas gilva]
MFFSPTFFRRTLYFSGIACLLGLAPIALALEYTLNGVSRSDLKDNIKLHLNPISVTNGDPDETTEERIIKSVKTALQPFGFYNTDIALRTEKQALIIDVDLGEPLRVANVTREIIGEGRDDPEFKQRFNSFKLKPGDVMHQPTYESFKSSMFNYALSNGYFDYHWQATRLDLVREENEANVLLIAQSGRQYEFGEVRLEGDTRSSAIIGRIQPFQEGEKYTSAKLTKFNQQLNQTGYFSRVIARPLVSQAKGARVPIEVTLAHLPRDIFNVGGGASTDTGPRVRGRWERPWVNTRGHSITGELFASQLEQAASLDYRIPLEDVNNDYASIKTSYEFQDNDNSDTKRETLSISAHRFWKEAESPWQRSLSLTYDREMFTQGLSDPQTINLLMPGYSIAFNNAEEKVDIDQGQYYRISAQVAHEDLASDISLAKVLAQAKIITTLDDTHRLFFRAEAGAIYTEEFNRVPSSIRFFTGGDQSVRGFGYQQISPFVLNDEGNRVLTGGKYLATASIEYAYPIADNWRAAVFSDVGTSTNDFSDPLARSVGIGAHWLTLIGPVRFYVARGKNAFESTWRIHFTLGPEL